jgi:uncharacterized RDD family membrane protein YckC
VNRTNTLLIRTPEGVVFSQTLAGPVTRFLAWLVDALILWAVLMVISLLTIFTALITPDTPK